MSDARVIMMVAQQSFEVETNRFCKLIPIVYTDGTAIDISDFPNDGEIWWMITPQTHHLAVPGRLLVGSIEDAKYNPEDPASSRYQVKREAISEITLNDAAVILSIEDGLIESISDLVNSSITIKYPEVQPQAVYIRWRRDTYGPFRLLRTEEDSSKATVQSVNPADPYICRIDEDTFSTVVGEQCRAIEEYVSITRSRRSEQGDLKKIEACLLLKKGQDLVSEYSQDRLSVEPLDRMLTKLSRSVLTRKEKQDLQAILNNIEIKSRGTDIESDLFEVIKQKREYMRVREETTGKLAEALLQSGILGEDRIEEAQKRIAREYIEERKAQLEANIQEGIVQAEKRLAALKHEEATQKEKLRYENEEEKKRLEIELAEMRQQNELQISEQWQVIEYEKHELVRQRSILEGNLNQVVEEFKKSGDEVVNRFLTIAPLIRMFSNQDISYRGATEDVESKRTDPQAEAPSEKRQLEIPEYLSRNVLHGEMDEVDFFERFRNVVSESGFHYEEKDLKRFHLSVKCENITVLGGPSGTGKSSLPLLYSHALQGDEERVPGLLVNVSPSWMDMRDLLGHLNTLESKYQPSETGLYEYLLYAQMEYDKRETRTGMYIVTLDEMNLAQVEHYFGEFMMVLERPASERRIRCFSKDAVSDDCKFRKWNDIQVSTATRFVGTVNFDETTRLLSDRFLDRINLIELSAPNMPTELNAQRELSACNGQMVTLKNILSWQSTSALARGYAEVVDRMRPRLNRIGSPLSPRAYRGICRYVASARGLMTEGEAFDIQVSQRILPRLRNIITNDQRDALDEIRLILENSTVCSFDNTLPILESIIEQTRIVDWMGEVEQ